MAELKCLIELNKGEGILIKLKNPGAGIDQSIVMDGTSITTTCKGGETSTIVQTHDTITITSKNFNVVSDNVSIKASKDLKTEATNTSIKSTDLKTDSPQTSIKGANVKITGDAQVAVSGGIIKLQ